MENLTKENFWNDLMDKYPEEMKRFCAWIDEYKKRVDWERLFGNFSPEVLSVKVARTKYHDLPIAMQIGIFLQFTIENGGFSTWAHLSPEVKNMDSLVEAIRSWFESENSGRL